MNPIVDGIAGIGDAVSKIIGQFHMSPEQQAQVQAALAANQDKLAELDQQYKVKLIDANEQLNATAGENIRAEAQSGDRFVERARPAVIWGGLGIIFWNFCLVPTFGLHWHMNPVTLPDLFWEIWGVVSTGYVFARTGDKLFGGSGGTMNLPFGIKLDSKGDK